MSKVTAPLLSFGASGQIAKTQVYGSWRGINYVRQYTTPNNPRTAAQTKTRSVFTYLNQVWKLSAAAAQAPWASYATGRRFIDRNAYISFNLPVLRTPTDNHAFIGSPGSNGGIPPTSFAGSGAAGTVTGTFGVPTPPVGWTLTASHMVALKDQDPHVATDFTSYYGTATSTPWTVDITVPAGDYVVTGWLEYTKPDGTIAYSVSDVDTATAS